MMSDSPHTSAPMAMRGRALVLKNTGPEAVLTVHAPPPSAAAATARRKPDQFTITEQNYRCVPGPARFFEFKSAIETALCRTQKPVGPEVRVSLTGSSGALQVANRVVGQRWHSARRPFLLDARRPGVRHPRESGDSALDHYQRPGHRGTWLRVARRGQKAAAAQTLTRAASAFLASVRALVPAAPRIRIAEPGPLEKTVKKNRYITVTTNRVARLFDRSRQTQGMQLQGSAD